MQPTQQSCLRTLGSSLEAQGTSLAPLVGHDDGQLLGADMDAGGAAHALVGIYLGCAVHQLQGVEAAGLGAVAEAGAAVVAVAVDVQLHRLAAGGGAGVGIDLVVIPAAPAADKGGGGLELVRSWKVSTMIFLRQETVQATQPTHLS